MEIPQKIKKFWKKISKFKLKKPKIQILDDDDKEFVKELFSKILIMGPLLNLALFSIWGVEFNAYSWIGYGIGVYLIENKIVKWIRAIIFK